MDKKANTRTSSVPPKGNGGDSKKSDSGSGNRFPRHKKRESTGSKPRYEAGSCHHSAQQRSRGYDKRPRTRNYNDRPSSEVAQDPRAEYGSALQTGSKKANLNHLLNFTFEPRAGRGTNDVGRGRWPGRRYTASYNKEQFLQATCQFVVSDKGDYTVHGADPDVLVDWNLVEQVRVTDHEVPSCPICLYPPTAAKMTRCGHVYCWSCILHYLSLEDKKWRKCPICYESIHKDDLKSVRAAEQQVSRIGDQITMKLMKREKGSTYVMPKATWVPKDDHLPSLSDEVDVHFAKLLVAQPEEVQAILDGERQALQVQLREEGDSLEGSFVQSAIELLQERQCSLEVIKQVKGELSQMVESLAVCDEKQEKCDDASQGGDMPAGEAKSPWKSFAAGAQEKEEVKAFSDEEPEESEPPSGETKHQDDEQKELPPADAATGDCDPSVAKYEGHRRPSSADSEDPTDEIPLEEAMEELAMPAEGGTKPTSPQTSSDAVFFYQAADGRRVYMHSLNARCLVREYGSLENCPDTITATIVHMDNITMSEELRRRLRYLNHLPLTSQFQVAELALKPPILSKETIKEFMADIDQRKRARQKKARDEGRRARKMQDEENRRMGYPRSRPPPLTGPRQDASFNVNQAMADSPTLSPGATSHPAPAGTSSTALAASPPAVTPTSPTSSGSADDVQSSSSLSFAQMLRAGKAKPREAWGKAGTAQAEQSAAAPKLKSPGSDESDNEDRVPVPMFQTSFGVAIQEALDQMATNPDQNGARVKTPSSGKKKKGKKTLLFTTSMARTK